MARGKQGAAAARKAEAAMATAVAAAEAELSAETELLAVVRAEHEQLEARQGVLSALIETRQQVAHDELVHLREEEAVLRAAVQSAESHVAAIGAQWAPFSDGLLEAHGRGPQAIEALMEIISGFETGLRPDNTERMSDETVRKLKRARGGQREADSKPAARNEAHPLRGLVPPELDAALDSKDWPDGAGGTDGAKAAFASVRNAEWGLVSRDALHTWHPMPWVLDQIAAGIDHPVARALGATQITDFAAPSAGGASPPEIPLPSMTSAARQGLAAGASSQVIEAWTPQLARTSSQQRTARSLSNPLAAFPAHAGPLSAVQVKHWYTLAALGEWSRAETGHPESAHVYGEAAIGIASAAPYWLPRAQTFDFMDSEPLTDFEDLRLPYPQVLLTFAEPPRISPAAGIERSASLSVIDATLLTEPRRPKGMAAGPMRLLAAASANRHGLGFGTSIWDAIAERGARVESILLLADSLGRMSGLMAWGLAVPSAYGGVICRVLIPAMRDASMWSAQVLNAAAVVSWADWHMPIDVVPAGSDSAAAAVPAAPPAPEDQVRVLATRRTAAGGARAASGDGRSVAAHLRRGHWRRQHHGPRGELVKRVRIAPVVVNAQRRSFAARVYVLPSTAADVTLPA